eukprot:m.140929 g.140929  ORF g.140929 m.140929 type:complete len:379 (-) comp30150_c0_seq1:42-1178(-)
MTLARNKSLVVVGVLLFVFISTERSLTFVGSDPEQRLVDLSTRPAKSTASVALGTSTIPTLRATSRPPTTTQALVPGYTIVINTYKRNGCLKQAIDHWLTCNPTQIRVVWPDPKNPLPDYVGNYDKNKVVFDEYPGTNMSYRFHPAPFITEAVFPIDDDCSYVCSAMDLAFKLFSEDPQNAMVGFAPRKVHPDGGYWQAESFNNFVYNTLFVTKGAFLHKRWFSTFWEPQYQSIRWLVDKNITAEDLLFSSIYAKVAKQSPIAMQIKYKHRFHYKCFNDTSLAMLGGFPSPNMRRKILTNYFFEHLGNCTKLNCSCKAGFGDSSSNCLCNDEDKPDKPYGKQTPVDRCGYPFTFADATQAFNVTSKKMEPLTKQADFI